MVTGHTDTFKPNYARWQTMFNFDELEVPIFRALKPLPTNAISSFGVCLGGDFGSRSITEVKHHWIWLVFA